ncbi:MAG: hypothetical protein P4L53_17900 [Candidatus Obscuribacterales bacterium]|nr:hypothetical protein [Candidatus Obscuribacterales bacterium]
MHSILFRLKFINSLTICALILSQASFAAPSNINLKEAVAIGIPTADPPETSSTKQNLKTKKKRSNSGGLENESYEDLNLFQLKPSIINEKYYTSGRNERSQKTSPTLPPGAPIPDEDNYVIPSVKSGEAKDTDTAATSTELHSALIDSSLAQSLPTWSKETDDSHQVELELQVTECSEDLVTKLKALHAKILGTGTSMTIKIPARQIQSMSELKQITRIGLHQNSRKQEPVVIWDSHKKSSPTLPPGSPIPDNE